MFCHPQEIISLFLSNQLVLFWAFLPQGLLIRFSYPILLFTFSFPFSFDIFKSITSSTSCETPSFYYFTDSFPWPGIDFTNSNSHWVEEVDSYIALPKDWKKSYRVQIGCLVSVWLRIWCLWMVGLGVWWEHTWPYRVIGGGIYYCLPLIVPKDYMAIFIRKKRWSW